MTIVLGAPLAMVLAASAIPALAQLPQAEIDRHLAAIPAAQRSLDARLGSFAKRERRYTNAGGEGAVAGYFEGKQLRKLVVTFDGDGASWVETYYFERQALFLATLEWRAFALHPGQKDTVDEARFEFGYQTLLRWRKRDYLAQEKKRPPFEQETDQTRIADRQADLLRNVVRYRAFLDSNDRELPE